MSPRFDLIFTSLEGLTVVQRKPMEDNRGFFERLFCSEELRDAGVHKPIVQINRSVTHELGTVRGMHFQYPPHTETKIISCLKGEIFDVAVDIRSNSPTFLRWHGEILSAKNCRSLLIPEGFAHGFQTLVNDCELLYLHTAAYTPEAEAALNAADPRLGISWPHPIVGMSDRDSLHPLLGQDFGGIQL